MHFIGLAGIVLKKKYFPQLVLKDLNDFDDDFVAPGSAPFTLLIEGKNRMLASVEGWRDGDEWTMKSTEQSEVHLSAFNSLVKDFWSGKKNFLPTAPMKK